MQFEDLAITLSASPDGGDPEAVVVTAEFAPGHVVTDETRLDEVIRGGGGWTGLKQLTDLLLARGFGDQGGLDEPQKALLAEALGRMLCPEGEIRRHALRALDAHPDRGLRLLLSCDDPELDSLPWEFASLGHRQAASIMRSVADPLDLRGRAEWNLVVMRIVGASNGRRETDLEVTLFNTLPEDALLDVTELEQGLGVPLAEAIVGDRRYLGRRATYERFDEDLPGAVLHWRGHGHSERDGRGGFGAGVEFGMDRPPRPVGVDEFVTRVREMRVTKALVFVAACKAGHGGPYGGLGAELVRSGIPVAISSLALVEREASEIFAAAFYRLLFEGAGLDEAMLLARRAVASDDRTTVATDWWVFTLQCSDPDAVTFVPRTRRGPYARLADRASTWTWFDVPTGGAESRYVRADVRHEVDDAVARLSRCTAPAAGISTGDRRDGSVRVVACPTGRAVAWRDGHVHVALVDQEGEGLHPTRSGPVAVSGRRGELLGLYTHPEPGSTLVDLLVTDHGVVLRQRVDLRAPGEVELVVKEEAAVRAGVCGRDFTLVVDARGRLRSIGPDPDPNPLPFHPEVLGLTDVVDLDAVESPVGGPSFLLVASPGELRLFPSGGGRPLRRRSAAVAAARLVRSGRRADRLEAVVWTDGAERPEVVELGLAGSTR